jgi:hypothetical protein
MSTATVSTESSGVNLQALLLAIGIENKELESDLFVGNIEMGLAYNALARVRSPWCAHLCGFFAALGCWGRVRLG